MLDEKTVLNSVKLIQDGNKKNMVRIPISEIVKIVYTPTGSEFSVLVASPEATGQNESMLVYVEGGSQHGMLGLWDIPTQRSKGLPPQNPVQGLYDRDDKTRQITAVYLKPDDVLKGTYFGTLDDLLKNPNVIKRKTD